MARECEGDQAQIPPTSHCYDSTSFYSGYHLYLTIRITRSWSAPGFDESLWRIDSFPVTRVQQFCEPIDYGLSCFTLQLHRSLVLEYG
jgi:hypothetical protein